MACGVATRCMVPQKPRGGTNRQIVRPWCADFLGSATNRSWQGLTVGEAVDLRQNPRGGTNRQMVRPSLDPATEHQ